MLVTGASAQNASNWNWAEFEKNHIDTLSKDVYLDTIFCNQYHLKLFTKKFTRTLHYVNNSASDTCKFNQVFDVRWKFTSEEDAMKFFTDHENDLAENGDRVKSFKLKIKGIGRIKVYQENEQLRIMTKNLGLKQKSFCFLFVYKKYVAKVFVFVKPEVTAKEASVFAIEAARRLMLNGN